MVGMIKDVPPLVWVSMIPARLLLACGTAWVFTGVLTSPDMTNLPQTLDLNFHAVPDRWTLSQSLGGLGASFEWWMNKTLFAEKQTVIRTEMFALLNTEMEEHKNGPRVVLPAVNRRSR